MLLSISVHRTAPTTKNCLVPNVNGARARNPGLGCMSSGARGIVAVMLMRP